MSDATANIRADAAGGQVLAAPDSQARAKRAQTILVAGDDVAHRKLVAEMLTRQGYSVVLAWDGEEALARVEAGGVDLVVAAVSMPKIGGLELLRAMRTLKARPQIVLIASGTTEMDAIYLKAAGALGAARGHTWPLTPSVFLGNISDLLEHQPGT